MWSRGHLVFLGALLLCGQELLLQPDCSLLESTHLHLPPLLPSLQLLSQLANLLVQTQHLYTHITHTHTELQIHAQTHRCISI